jgi:hypothetical protein
MAIINWPSDLPQAFLETSYAESLAENWIRDQFDIGPASVRRRTTAAIYPVTGAMVMTDAQWIELKAFFADVLLQGVLPFGFPYPGVCEDDTVTTGTTIGDFDLRLPDAFDGVTNASAGSSAAKNSGTTAYIGKSLEVSGRVTAATTYPANNAGYYSGGAPNITVSLLAKTGVVPANANDGTVLATSSPFVDGDDQDVSLTSDDPDTHYDHVWVKIAHDGAASAIFVAEAQIYVIPDVLVRFTAPPKRARMGFDWQVNLELEVLP